MAEAPYVDLLDPGEEALLARAPVDLEAADVWQLVRPPGDARPRIVARERYVLAVLLVAVAVPQEDRVYYQELDLVLAPEQLVVVRKTPPDGEPFAARAVAAACNADAPPAVQTTRLLDVIAEAYLSLVDDVDAEVDELEDRLDDLAAREIGRRIAGLRHDILRIRRTLTPTRDAVRRLVDGRIEAQLGHALLTHEAEMELTDVLDKLLRATEGLDIARDLVASARDYHQAQIAAQANEVSKRLAVVASLLLVPTFIVGVYGQNFDTMPELHWRLGYAFSWALIAATTIAQLAFFRWKRWI